MQTILVKTLSKGQVTIPSNLRNKFGIKKNTYLRVSSRGYRIILEPINLKTTDTNLNKYIRTFSDKEIKEWLKLDKLDKKTRKKAEKLLK